MAEQYDSLLKKLDEIEARYSDIEKQISDPDIANDSAKLISLAKEQGKLKAIVTKYRVYKKTTIGIEEARQILADRDAEKDFRTLAEEELEQLTTKATDLLEKIASSFVMADDMEIYSVIFEIRAGTGGEEAALFARDLYGMYVKYAESRKWKVESLDFS